MTELSEQPTPSASCCPYCGGDPAHDPKHVLSANGYLHDDVSLTCEECGEKWTCGVPIGEYDGPLAEDLFCGSCQTRYGLVHRVEPLSESEVRFHMKCPDDDCKYFWQFRREGGDHGVILLGYPQITGDVESANEAYGYPAHLHEED